MVSPCRLPAHAWILPAFSGKSPRCLSALCPSVIIPCSAPRPRRPSPTLGWFVLLSLGRPDAPVPSTRADANLPRSVPKLLLSAIDYSLTSFISQLSTAGPAAHLNGPRDVIIRCMQ